MSELDVTETYSAGNASVTVHHLGRASFCGIGGDSGAPMYTNHVAYGLPVSGFSLCDSTYQGIHAAKQILNVDVLHLSPVSAGCMAGAWQEALR